MSEFLLFLGHAVAIGFALIGFFATVGALSSKRRRNKLQKAESARAAKEWNERVAANLRQNELRSALQQELTHLLPQVLRKTLTETKFFVEHKTQENAKYEKNKVAACYPPYGQPTGVNLRLFELYKQPSVVCSNTVGTTGTNAETGPVPATDSNSVQVVNGPR